MNRKTLNELYSYKKLKHGWDGFDAAPPTKEMVDTAIEFIKLLDIDPDEVSPGDDHIVLQYGTNKNVYWFDVYAAGQVYASSNKGPMADFYVSELDQKDIDFIKSKIPPKPLEKSKPAMVYKVAGSKAPFFSCTKAGYERLGMVIMKHKIQVISSMIVGRLGDRGTTAELILLIPAKSVNAVKKELKVSLEDPKDIQVGTDTLKSVKWIDHNGDEHTEPYKES
jgi:hypothetical protein